MICGRKRKNVLDSNGVMTKHIRVAFIYPWLSSFSKNDLDMLRTNFEVIEVHFTRDLQGILNIIKSVFKSDVSFVWFGSLHAFITVFFTKLFRKKSIVVAGGFETMYIPEINSGMMGRPLLKYIPKLTFRFANVVLAVSEFTKNQVLKNAKPMNIMVLYNGFDIKRFYPSGEKEDIAIMVAEISKSNLGYKRLKTFIETAKLLPDLKFILIGPYLDSTIDYLKSIAPKNIEFTNFLQYEELLPYYQIAKVYVQISAVESFGCALSEAMLCECVPVVTNRGALPEVVGDTGFYVPCDDPKATAESIKKALCSDGSKSRKRILKLFPINNRENKLIDIIKECCNV